MGDQFLYDTHYQVDKPFALIDLTLSTASPNRSSRDEVLARLLSEQAKSKSAISGDEEVEWKINKDAMKYWLGNCHQTGLLSRQNAFDYWLMNFVWNDTFRPDRNAWGLLCPESTDLSRALLFRWAWIHDAPMLSAIMWYLSVRGPVPARRFTESKPCPVEQMVVATLSGLREMSSDIRTRTEYRRKIEEISKYGFQPNTRRHKLHTHLALLVDSGIVRRSLQGEYSVPEQVQQLLKDHESLATIVRRSLESGPIGLGGQLFLRLVSQAYGVIVGNVAELTDRDWANISAEIRSFWQNVLAWDRKFLGIAALAELFLVKNLMAGTALWPVDSWKTFLMGRARKRPEEMTVHVGRFGDIRYLRFNDD